MRSITFFVKTAKKTRFLACFYAFSFFSCLHPSDPALVKEAARTPNKRKRRPEAEEVQRTSSTFLSRRSRFGWAFFRPHPPYGAAGCWGAIGDPTVPRSFPDINARSALVFNIYIYDACGESSRPQSGRFFGFLGFGKCKKCNFAHFS